MSLWIAAGTWRIVAEMGAATALFEAVLVLSLVVLAAPEGIGATLAARLRACFIMRRDGALGRGVQGSQRMSR